jgi:hypothetical protein
MREYKRCNICGRYGWIDGAHKCPPAWLVCTLWDYQGYLIELKKGEATPENLEYFELFYAATRKDAAEEWAEHSDQRGEFEIARSGFEEIVVIAIDGSEPEVQIFGVTAESSAEYTAMKKEVEDAPAV